MQDRPDAEGVGPVEIAAACEQRGPGRLTRRHPALLVGVASRRLQRTATAQQGARHVADAVPGGEVQARHPRHISRDGAAPAGAEQVGEDGPTAVDVGRSLGRLARTQAASSYYRPRSVVQRAPAILRSTRSSQYHVETNHQSRAYAMFF